VVVDSRADLAELEQVFRRAPESTMRCNLQRLLDVMEQRGLDGLVSYYSPNVHYLSGARINRTFIHEANALTAVVISRHRPDHPIVITGSLYLTWFLHHPSWIEDRRAAGSAADFADPDTVIDVLFPESTYELEWVKRARTSYAVDMIDGIARAMSDVGLDRGRVGFDNPRIGPAVCRHLEPDPPEVVDAYGLMKHVRMIKTPEEVVVMKQAAALNQVLQEKIVRDYVRGTTWRDVDGWYMATAARLGGVTEGYNTTIYYPRPGAYGDGYVFLSRMEEDFELEPGMGVLFDCHGAWNSYLWDGGKAWYVEEPSAAATSVGVALGDATEAMVEAAKPGVTFGELRDLAREVIRKQGLPQPNRNPIFFHGMGLEASDMEAPGADALDATKLEEGMCIATHCFYLGDQYDRGYIEDVGVVTKDGLDRFFTWDFYPHQP
jgi:Xaa-Pro aminopeptidase